MDTSGLGSNHGRAEELPLVRPQKPPTIYGDDQYTRYIGVSDVREYGFKIVNLSFARKMYRY